MVAALGFAVACSACCFYGTYFVPARKYEIHDGLVFQWFQCSGILLSGLIVALLRNAWDRGDNCSPGFYVCPEGLLSGLIFVLANAIANTAVKTCGIGNYYTLHQVSNLGATFVVGVFGPSFGIPATPPGSVELAALGIVLVLVGAVPIMFMEPEAMNDREDQPGACPPPDPDAGMPSALEDLFSADRPRAQSNVSAAALPTGPLRRLTQEKVEQQMVAASVMRNFQGFNSHTWDGTVGRPRLNFEKYGNKFAPSFLEGLVHLEAVSEGGDGDAGGPSLLDAPLIPSAVASSRMAYWWGVFLCFAAGFLYSVMYVPQIVWRARVQADGWTPSGFDAFFSMAVGIYCGSSAWLIGAGAYKRYHGHKMEKPVLRPALMTGMIYGAACICYLVSMMLLPYVVAYALGVGGGMVVSQLWGILVFGEASSAYNRRLVKLSFACMSIGIACLGMSA